MNEEELLNRIRDAVQRFALTDEELAALCGCSAPTARALRNGVAVPIKPATRAGAERFAVVARRARRRSDLRLP